MNLTLECIHKIMIIPSSLLCLQVFMITCSSAANTQLRAYWKKPIHMLSCYDDLKHTKVPEIRLFLLHKLNRTHTHALSPDYFLSKLRGTLASVSLGKPEPACPRRMGGFLPPPEKPSGTLVQSPLQTHTVTTLKDLSSNCLQHL